MRGLEFKDWVVPSHTWVSISTLSGHGIRVCSVPSSAKVIGLGRGAVSVWTVATKE